MRIMGRGPVLALIGALVLASGPAWAESNPNGPGLQRGRLRGRARARSRRGRSSARSPTVSTRHRRRRLRDRALEHLRVPDDLLPGHQPALRQPVRWLAPAAEQPASTRGSTSSRSSCATASRAPTLPAVRRDHGASFPIACRELRTRHDLHRHAPESREQHRGELEQRGAERRLPPDDPARVAADVPLPARAVRGHPDRRPRLDAARHPRGGRGDAPTRARPTSRTPPRTRSTCATPAATAGVDDGEECDPNAPQPCMRRLPAAGAARTTPRWSARRDADCSGTCVAPDDPSECICLF